MAHFVTCKYCGIRFDRDLEPAIEVSSRRYAHKTCAEKVEATVPQDEKDYANLENYIKKIFKLKTLSAKIRKQIKDYREEYNYTYSGMLKTLYWWYEIKGNTTELSNEGIGIVPFVYDDACKYYYTLYMAKMVNDNVVEYKPKVEEVEIAAPRVYINPTKLFKIDDNED